jgi:hypothetical protein
MFDDAIKSHLIFGTADEVESFPDSPGIYAWFLPLRGYDAGTVDEYVRELIEGFNSAAKLTEASGEVGQLELSVKRRAPSIDIGGAPVNLTPQELQMAAKVMLSCSFLGAPIYIGMTVNIGLQGRIRQHLANPEELYAGNWTGSFRSRVAKLTGNRSFLRRCLVAMLPMPQEKFSPELIKFFEHVLIRAIRPALSRRG